MDQDQSLPVPDLEHLGAILAHAPPIELWNALSQKLEAWGNRTLDTEDALAEAGFLLDRLYLTSSDCCFCEECRTKVLAAVKAQAPCPICYPAAVYQALRVPHGVLVCGFCLSQDTPYARRHAELRGLLEPFLPEERPFFYADDVEVPLPGEPLVEVTHADAGK